MINLKNTSNDIEKGKGKSRIYLDHAATTYLLPEVEEAMRPFGQIEFGNPSGIYDLGRTAHMALDKARSAVADLLKASHKEIIFTGSGTASDNLAVLGIARAHRDEGSHLITTAIEHHAVLHPFSHLAEKENFKTTILPVQKNGIVDVDSVKNSILPETILVSVMYANNEIGTIQPLADIGELIEKINKEREITNLPRIYFHTDACQAAGALYMDVQKLKVDLLTMNGSKLYGPKGVGVLYVRKGVELEPLIFGGGQERGLISGTENIAGIVGLATAFELVQKKREEENARLIKLRDKLIKGILENIPKSRLNGDAKMRLPNNVNVTILDVEGEAMLLYLNEYGIFAATGSACDSYTFDPSHVILALGLPYEFAHGSLRFTLGSRTTEEDIDYVLEVLPLIVKTLRRVSPVKLRFDAPKRQHAKLLQHDQAINPKTNV